MASARASKETKISIRPQSGRENARRRILEEEFFEDGQYDVIICRKDKTENLLRDLFPKKSLSFSDFGSTMGYMPSPHSLYEMETISDSDRLEDFVECITERRWEDVADLLNRPLNYAKLRNPTTGFYPLHHMARMNNPNLEIMQMVAKRYPRALHARTSFGLLPLHLCIFQPTPDTNTIRALLELEGSRQNSSTARIPPLPLHLSLLHNADEAAILRIVSAFKGATLFDCMCQSRSTGKKSPRDKLNISHRQLVMAGGLPLHLALRFNASSAVVSAILDAYPMAIEAVDTRKRTPLHYLAMKGTDAEERVPAFAPENGYSQLTRQQMDTLTSIMCSDSGSLSSKFLLTAAKKKDTNGCLPLHYAVKSRNFATPGACHDTKTDDEPPKTEPLWKILITMNSRACRVIDKNGKLPLHHAAQTVAKCSADRTLTKKVADMFSAVLEAYTAGALVSDHAQCLPLHYILQATTGDGSGKVAYDIMRNLLTFTVGRLPGNPELVDSLCTWFEHRKETATAKWSASMMGIISKTEGFDIVGDMLHNMLSQAVRKLSGKAGDGQVTPQEGGLEVLDRTNVHRKKRWLMDQAVPLEYDYIPFGHSRDPNILANTLTQVLNVLVSKDAVGQWSGPYLRSIVWPVVLLYRTRIQRRIAFWTAVKQDASHRRQKGRLLSRLRDDLAAQLKGMNEKFIQPSLPVRAVEKDPYFESFLHRVDQIQRELHESALPSKHDASPSNNARPKHLLETAYMQAATLWKRFQDFVLTVATATRACNSHETIMPIHRACEVLSLGIGLFGAANFVLKSKPICSTLAVAPAMLQTETDAIVVFTAVLLYKTMRQLREAMISIVGLTHLVTVVAVSNEFSITGGWRRLKLIMHFNNTGTFFEVILSHTTLAQAARTYNVTAPTKAASAKQKPIKPTSPKRRTVRPASARPRTVRSAFAKPRTMRPASAKPRIIKTKKSKKNLKIRKSRSELEFQPLYQTPKKKKATGQKNFTDFLRQEQELESAHAEVSALLLRCTRYYHALDQKDGGGGGKSSGAGSTAHSKTKNKISQAKRLDALVNAPFKVGEMVFAQYQGQTRTVPWQRATIIKKEEIEAADALYAPRTRPMTRHLDPLANIRPSYTLRYESGMIETHANPINMQRFNKKQQAAMQATAEKANRAIKAEAPTSAELSPRSSASESSAGSLSPRLVDDDVEAVEWQKPKTVRLHGVVSSTSFPQLPQYKIRVLAPNSRLVLRLKADDRFQSTWWSDGEEAAQQSKWKARLQIYQSDRHLADALAEDKQAPPRRSAERTDLPFWLLDCVLPGHKPVAQWSQTEFHDGSQTLQVVLQPSPVPYLVVVVPADAQTQGYFTLEVEGDTSAFYAAPVTLAWTHKQAFQGRWSVKHKTAGGALNIARNPQLRLYSNSTEERPVLVVFKPQDLVLCDNKDVKVDTDTKQHRKRRLRSTFHVLCNSKTSTWYSASALIPLRHLHKVVRQHRANYGDEAKWWRCDDEVQSQVLMLKDYTLKSPNRRRRSIEVAVSKSKDQLFPHFIVPMTKDAKVEGVFTIEVYCMADGNTPPVTVDDTSEFGTLTAKFSEQSGWQDETPPRYLTFPIIKSPETRFLARLSRFSHMIPRTHGAKTVVRLLKVNSTFEIQAMAAEIELVDAFDGMDVSALQAAVKKVQREAGQDRDWPFHFVTANHLRAAQDKIVALEVYERLRNASIPVLTTWLSGKAEEQYEATHSWIKFITPEHLATKQNELALAVSEACQCQFSPGHPVLVLAKSTLQCLEFAIELKRLGKFDVKKSRRQILFEAEHVVHQRHHLLCQHDWRKLRIDTDMDVVAENSAHVKKAWKIAWPVSKKKRKLTAAATSVGEMPLEIQFEDDPEGERRTTTKWHMPDHLTDYLNNEISLHKRALRTRMKLKTIFSFSAALGGISSLQASAAARRLKEVSEDATKTNEAENSPTASPGLEASKEDPCTIAVAAAAGAKTLQVSHIRGRFEGESIVINQGGATEEVAVVAGFGSIVLQSPLRYDHAVGEIIVTNKTQELSAIEARLYEALDGTDLSLIQALLASPEALKIDAELHEYAMNVEEGLGFGEHFKQLLQYEVALPFLELHKKFKAGSKKEPLPLDTHTSEERGAHAMNLRVAVNAYDRWLDIEGFPPADDFDDSDGDGYSSPKSPAPKRDEEGVDNRDDETVPLWWRQNARLRNNADALATVLSVSNGIVDMRAEVLRLRESDADDDATELEKNIIPSEYFVRAMGERSRGSASSPSSPGWADDLARKARNSLKMQLAARKEEKDKKIPAWLEKQSRRSHDNLLARVGSSRNILAEQNNKKDKKIPAWLKKQSRRSHDNLLARVASSRDMLAEENNEKEKDGQSASEKQDKQIPAWLQKQSRRSHDNLLERVGSSRNMLAEQSNEKVEDEQFSDNAESPAKDLPSPIEGGNVVYADQAQALELLRQELETGFKLDKDKAATMVKKYTAGKPPFTKLRTVFQFLEDEHERAPDYDIDALEHAFGLESNTQVSDDTPHVTGGKDSSESSTVASPRNIDLPSPVEGGNVVYTDQAQALELLRQELETGFKLDKDEVATIVQKYTAGTPPFTELRVLFSSLSKEHDRAPDYDIDALERAFGLESNTQVSDDTPHVTGGKDSSESRSLPTKDLATPVEKGDVVSADQAQALELLDFLLPIEEIQSSTKDLPSPVEEGGVYTDQAQALELLRQELETGFKLDKDEVAKMVQKYTAGTPPFTALRILFRSLEEEHGRARNYDINALERVFGYTQASVYDDTLDVPVELDVASVTQTSKDSSESPVTEYMLAKSLLSPIEEIRSPSTKDLPSPVEEGGVVYTDQTQALELLRQELETGFKLDKDEVAKMVQKYTAGTPPFTDLRVLFKSLEEEHGRVRNYDINALERVFG